MGGLRGRRLEVQGIDPSIVYWGSDEVYAAVGEFRRLALAGSEAEVQGLGAFAKTAVLWLREVDPDRLRDMNDRQTLEVITRAWIPAFTFGRMKRRWSRSVATRDW